MTKQTLTPWFPPDIKPVREGVYEIHSPDFSGIWYSFWDNKNWGWVSRDKEFAVKRYISDPDVRHDAHTWRGLTEQPK